MTHDRPPELHFTDGSTIQKYRKAIGLTQHEFWSRIGVTQSGGSRYENERDIPLPVQILLELTYGPEDQSSALFQWLRGNHKLPVMGSRED